MELPFLNRPVFLKGVIMKHKPFFSMSKAERYGFFVFVFLAFTFLIIPRYMRYQRDKKEMQVTLEYLNSKTLKPIEKQVVTSSISEKEEDEAVYFDFDPNLIPKETWVQFGLSEAQADVVMFYQERGGRFRKKEDLRKVYVVSEEFYRSVEPYIFIEPAPSKRPEKNSKKKDRVSFERKDREEKKEFSYISTKADKDYRININTADTSEWKKLRGIGPALSLRIIKFREGLGGFHSVDQVSEVYGIEPEVFASFKENLLTPDPLSFQRIKINKATADELGKHPYISKKEARIIINYREQHGDFKNREDFDQIKGINKDKVSKIFPYLDFEPSE